MSLVQYLGENVKIICDEGKVWEGFICSYIDPDDNDPEVEAIIMDHKPSGSLIEFREEEIASIEIVE